MDWRPYGNVLPHRDRNVSPGSRDPSELLDVNNFGSYNTQPPSPTTLIRGRTRRHGSFRGIRSRSGKWASEIREPGKATRIWLGTFPTPEMAAAAYDVVLLMLKGPAANFNFPDSVSSYPVPASASASDIRAAAAMAAEARREMAEQHSDATVQTQPWNMNNYNHNYGDGDGECGAGSRSRGAEMTAGGGGEFIDEEALFDMPNLLANMAAGMLVSPPRANRDDSPPNSPGGGDNLWT